MAYEYQRVRLAEVNAEDDRYLLRYPFPEIPLEFPEAVPIVLTRQKPHILVSGFRRFRALQKAGRQDLEALVLAPELSEQAIFQLAVAWNQGAILTDLDKSCLVWKAKNFFRLGQPEILKLTRNLFEGKTGEKLIAEFAQLWEMQDSLKRYMAHHRFGFKFAMPYLALSPKEQSFLGEAVLPLLQVSAAEFRALPELTRDISQREGLALEGIFLEEEIAHVLHAEALAPRQKAEKLLSLLWHRRNPVQAQLARKRSAFERNLKFKTTVQFEVPDAYEQDHFFLHIRFRDQQELAGAVEEIQHNLSGFAQVEQLLELE